MTSGVDRNQGGPEPPGGAPNPYAPPRAELEPPRPQGPVRLATVGEVFAAYPVVLRRSLAVIAWPYALLVLASLVFVSGPMIVMQYQQIEALQSGDLAAIYTRVLPIYGVIVLLSLPIVTLQQGLALPLRVAAVEGPGVVGGLGDAFRRSASRFWSTLGSLFLVFVGLMVGTLVCCVGVLPVAYFLAAAPYLTAACGESATDGIARSLAMTRRNVGAFMALMGVLVGASLVIAGLNFGVAFLFQDALGPLWGQITAQLVSMIWALPLGYLLWVFFTSGLIVIETAESGVPLKL